jgi:hypothetical protein
MEVRDGRYSYFVRDRLVLCESDLAEHRAHKQLPLILLYEEMKPVKTLKYCTGCNV